MNIPDEYRCIMLIALRSLRDQTRNPLAAHDAERAIAVIEGREPPPRLHKPRVKPPLKSKTKTLRSVPPWAVELAAGMRGNS